MNRKFSPRRGHGSKKSRSEMQTFPNIGSAGRKPRSEPGVGRCWAIVAFLTDLLPALGRASGDDGSLCTSEPENEACDCGLHGAERPEVVECCLGNVGCCVAGR